MEAKKEFLLIVEAPAKAKKISNFLRGYQNANWTVIASGGHIKDLPIKELGIIKQNNSVEGQWTYAGSTASEVKQNKDFVAKIKALLPKIDMVFMGTDADREGERIAFDIIEACGIKNYMRIEFREINLAAVVKAIENARHIDQNIVNAQKAKRLINRLGYTLSSIIKWDFKRKNKTQLPNGIGSVIVPALKILVDNKRLRDSFVPEEFKNIIVEYQTDYDEQTFYLTLTRKFKTSQKIEIENALRYLRGTSKGSEPKAHIVKNYISKVDSRTPYPFLTTTTMIRAANYASNMLYMPKQTMALAQKLYECDFITYHRTDQPNCSESASIQIMEAVVREFGENAVFRKHRKFKVKDWAQEGHECIRPVYLDDVHHPNNVKSLPDWSEYNLTDEHWRLYRLIWYRTIIAQMKESIKNVSVLEVQCGEMVLHGKTNLYARDENNEPCLGWEKPYREILKENDPDADEKFRYIPELHSGNVLSPKDISSFTSKTERPDRYGVGRFTTTLEDKGIGRPATIATMIHSIVDKSYSGLVQNLFEPTQLGVDIIAWCEENCPWLCDIEAASELENAIDRIEKGEEEYSQIFFDYEKKVQLLADSIGYNLNDDNTPSQEQIDFVLSVAQQKGIKIDSSMLESKEKCAVFLKRYQDSFEILGKCPSCGKGSVVEKESKPNAESGAITHYYSCTRKECNFVLFKKSLISFFDRFRRNTDEEELRQIIQGILKSPKSVGYEVDRLIGSDEKPRSASLTFVNTQNYGWGVGFINKKQNQRVK